MVLAIEAFLLGAAWRDGRNAGRAEQKKLDAAECVSMGAGKQLPTVDRPEAPLTPPAPKPAPRKAGHCLQMGCLDDESGATVPRKAEKPQ